MMQLTKEQQAVIDAKLAPGEMLKTRAYAGTGKTSTKVAYARANPALSMLYLAFNKTVATEAASKFPGNVRAKTAHALAWASKGRDYANIASNVRFFHVTKRLKIDVYAATLVCQTLDNFLNSADPEFMRKHAAPDVQAKFKNDMSEHLIKCAGTIWNDMVNENAPFQMTHSGYLKLYQLSEPRLNYDVIMLDEAQDTNPVTFDIVNRQREHGVRVLLAGDPYQQIYSWRGAVDAMSVECRSLYLTQSFRFGNHVASVANKLLNTFFQEKVPVIGNGKPDALVPDMPKGEKYTVICRTNVELFTQAVTHVSANMNVCVIGEQAFSTWISGLRDVYAIYAGRLSDVKDRSLSFFKDYKEFKKFAIDRMDMELLAKISIVEKYQSALPRHIDTVVAMNVAESFAQVILVTAHKAKGLEWDNVILANDFEDLFDDDGRLVKIKQQVQADTSLSAEMRKLLLEEAIEKDEINLLYVAATRAKRHLKLNSDLNRLMTWKPEDEPPARTLPEKGGKEDRPYRAPAAPARIRDLFDDSSRS
jgi:F-box protein 18 (helicase)